MKAIIISAIAAMALLTTGCMEKNREDAPGNETAGIFPKGELGAAENFTGNAWNTGLVANDTTYNTVVGNVYFEPGARSNWHTHPAGQILIITAGVGYHQIKGQPRQTIRKGDVVKCPPNVLHWHGASPDTGMQQLYILPKTEKGIVTWLEKVTDKEYNGGKQR
ncbi:MAG: cupin domain-containing protein [Sphingobacteriales bacterium]|nr:MAG: cupin domain-containing protein [Sphingobacteriales bacterium]